MTGRAVASLLSFALAHYLALALLALIACLIGRRLTRKLDCHSPLERFSFSLSLGLGAIAHLILLLGLFGLLNRWTLGVAILLALALSWPSARSVRAAARALIESGWWRSPVVLVVAAFGALAAAPLLLLPLYPPTASDAIGYHLASAKIYAREGALVFTPYLRYPVFPQMNQMLFTGALLFYDDLFAQGIELLLLIALAASVASAGRRYFNSRAGWWALGLTLGSPLVVSVGTIAYVDVALMTYVFLAVYAFWNWRATGARAWLLAAGVCGGIGVSIKYSSLFFVVVIGLWVIYAGIKERDWRGPLLFAGGVMVAAGPWLLRNFYYTRNPLFPFFADLFADLFGTGRWKREYLEGLVTLQPGIGVGRSALAFIKLPFLLAFHPEVFNARNGISPFYLLLLPAAILGAWRDARIRLMLAFTLGFTLFWFFSFQELRYLLPALPFLALAAGAALARVVPGRGMILTAVVALFFFIPGWLYAVGEARRERRPPVTTDARNVFLTMRLPSYPIYQFLNERHRADYTVYAFYEENMTYYADGQLIGDWVGPGAYARLLSRMQDGETFYAALNELGANYLLVDHTRQTDQARIELPADAFSRRHFHPIYKRANLTLYDLRGRIEAPREGENLLRNAGFEQLDGDRPAGWEAHGRPAVEISPDPGHPGRIVVCAGEENAFSQRVAVRPGAFYRLSYLARTDEPDARSRMQVNWYDAADRFLGIDVEVVEVGGEWRRYETTIRTPAAASSVVVYTLPHLRGRVRFDDFSMTELSYAPPKKQE